MFDERPLSFPGAVLLGSAPPPLVGKCLVPGCGQVFYAGEEQAWQRHVGQCARANLDRIDGAIRAGKLSVFEDYDPEVSAYLQGVVRPRMEREGRMEVKPNETAGNS